MRSFILTFLFVYLIVLQSKYTESAKKMNLSEVREMLRPMGKTCKTKSGASDELVAACVNGEFPKIRPLMCYFKCIMTMMKVMNKQGQISQKVLENQLDTLVIEELVPRMKEVGKICFDSVPFKEDSCEYAYDLVICGYGLESEMYFLP